MGDNFSLGSETHSDDAPETLTEIPDDSLNSEGGEIDVVVDDLEGDTGKEAMETLAHLSDKNKLNDELKATKIDHLDKSGTVDFNTLNILAKILDRKPVKRTDFAYETNNSEERAGKIESAMDASVKSLDVRGQDGSLSGGVSNESLDFLLKDKEVSDHAKIFVLINIQAKDAIDFSTMTFEDLENEALKIRLEGYEEKAKEILSFYKKERLEKSKDDEAEVTDSNFEENEQMDQIDLKALVEDVDMEDYLDVETSEIKLKEELSKDFKELISRFSKKSKIRQLENYLDKLSAEKQEQLLDIYRVALEKYKEDVLDKIMDLSNVEEINKNFEFVLENVKEILRNAEK